MVWFGTTFLMDTTRCEMPNDLRLLMSSIAEAVKKKQVDLVNYTAKFATKQELKCCTHGCLCCTDHLHKLGEDATVPMCSDTPSFGHQKDMSDALPNSGRALPG